MEKKERSTVARRAVIIEDVKTDGRVNVTDLSEKFGVSEVTIRNDLANLEKKNILIRARGGAIKLDPVGIDIHVSEKDKINVESKRTIGKAAATLVESGETIMIDSGSTAMELVKNLEDVKNLTVITNALNIASHLSQFPEIQVIVPGGFLRHKSLSLVGAPAEKSIGNYFCDKLFLGVDGLDIVHGLTTPNVEEAHFNSAMIEMSNQIILLADSSKIGKRSLASITPLSSVDILVTDGDLELTMKEQIEALGVTVIAS